MAVIIDIITYLQQYQNTISTNDAIWVEGVGSLSLINAPSGDPDVNEAGRIGCMFKNGVSFYSDLEIIDNCEATILSNPSLMKKSNRIKIIKRLSNKEYQIINLESVKLINLYAIDGSILIPLT